MDVSKVSCSSCGAAITIPPDIDSFNCTYCGSTLVVQRGEGYVGLKLVEEVSKSIQQVGVQTQSSILEGAQATQVELKRLQISQEISSIQFQLTTIQSEIRSLERQKMNSQIKKQLKGLKEQEANFILRIKELQTVLVPLNVSNKTNVSREKSVPKLKPVSERDWFTTFLLCFFLGIFGGHRFYTGHIVIGLIQLVTQGGFYLWWFVDLSLILMGKYKDSNGNLLKNRDFKSVKFICLIVFFITFVVMALIAPNYALLVATIFTVATFIYYRMRKQKEV